MVQYLFKWGGTFYQQEKNWPLFGQLRCKKLLLTIGEGGGQDFQKNKTRRGANLL